MPGYKITMLPDDVVKAYTLQEGRDCPALSLYVTFDEATLVLRDSQTRLERVPIVANLRHDKLDAVVTEESLQAQAPRRRPAAARAGPAPAPGFPAPPRAAPEGAARSRARQAGELQPARLQLPPRRRRWQASPRATSRCRSAIRKRGAPLDLIVAEAMILANSTWGSWLAEHGVPGIYRSQASLAPGVKVRMGTKALPHAGIGVKSYAWSTSPLRRYTDLVNQWQIIAAARHGRTAALAAPFKPKDAELFSIISSFDSAYAAYNGHQAGMERFWTLKYLQQNGITEITAPFSGRPGARRRPAAGAAAHGRDGLPRGARRARQAGRDRPDHAGHQRTVVERLDDAAAEGRRRKKTTSEEESRCAARLPSRST